MQTQAVRQSSWVYYLFTGKRSFQANKAEMEGKRWERYGIAQKDLFSEYCKAKQCRIKVLSLNQTSHCDRFKRWADTDIQQISKFIPFLFEMFSIGLSKNGNQKHIWTHL